MSEKSSIDKTLGEQGITAMPGEEQKTSSLNGNGSAEHVEERTVQETAHPPLLSTDPAASEPSSYEQEKNSASAIHIDEQEGPARAAEEVIGEPNGQPSTSTQAAKPVRADEQPVPVPMTMKVIESTEASIQPVEGIEDSEEPDESEEGIASSHPSNQPTEPELVAVPYVEGAEIGLTSVSGESPVVLVEAPAAPVTERGHLIRSSALVSIGNLGSSLMGMFRQSIVSGLGANIFTPFTAALTPANNFFQLLINGSVSGALVPTFNDYAAPDKREELRRIVYTLVNLVLIIALISAIGYTLIAPWFVNIFASGYPAEQKHLIIQYSQIIFFSLAALGPFAVLLGALFALKEFGWPAFATAAYHVGIIIGAVALGWLSSFPLHLMALPVGVLIGSLGEIALLLPGLRKQKLAYMFVLDLKHPALKRILRLYFPIAISFFFTTLQVFLDVRLQSMTPGNPVTHTTSSDNTAAMATATTLIQFPIGLVAMALSTAVLPTLSEHAREQNVEKFKQTLLLGFRMGLLLMIPAMVGLIVLRLPIVSLLFRHGHYTSTNAQLSALALQNYAYQLPFVAVDQLLIAAFYARKNTRTPVIIGIVGIAFYLAVALPFYSNIGMPALAFANTVQNTSHAIILLFLLRSAIGSLHLRQSLPAILKICLATVLMGGVAWGIQILLSQLALFSLNNLSGQFLIVTFAGIPAVIVYVVAILLLRVEEINLVKKAVLTKLGRK